MRGRRKPGRIGQVIGALATDILHGRAVAGSALPAEPDLGQRFGVSRSVVREAVKTLAAKGLVDVRPRLGTRVKPAGQWNVLDAEVIAWMLAEGRPDARLVRSLVEVREIIEPAAARLAAERATAPERAAIAAALADMAANRRDAAAAVAADKRFHMAILAAVDNPVVAAFAGVLERALDVLFPLSIENLAWFEENLDNHARVAEAIAKGDGAGAEAAMRAVLAFTRHNIVDHQGAANAPTTPGGD